MMGTSLLITLLYYLPTSVSSGEEEMTRMPVKAVGAITIGNISSA